MAVLVQALALAAAAVVLARVAGLLRLPAIIGMIAAGAIVRGSGLGSDFAGPALDDVSTEVRLAVLAVVLLRAGLGISLGDARAAGTLAMRFATVPMLADAGAVAVAAVVLLGVDLLTAIVLGLVVAPVSPAIVIPGVLALLHKRPGARPRHMLTALLVGAPLDNILAVLGLGLALDAAASGNADVGRALIGAGGSVLAGVVVGVAVGVLTGWMVRRVGRLDGIAGAFAVWGTALALVYGGLTVGFSFVLAIVAFGVALRHLARDRAEGLARGLARLWSVVQYALFGLIGYAVDVGPLADAGLLLLTVVIAGQLGRAAGSLLASARAGLTARERYAAVLAYVPKATIQAAFAGLALDRGLPSGALVLTAGVLAIVVTAPLGIIALQRGTPSLLPRTEG